MKLKPKALDALITERQTLAGRLAEIARTIAAHHAALSAARRAKRKPPSPPRAPIKTPDVQVVRDYVRKYLPGATVFNNRRKADRRVKIHYGLSPVVLEKHRSALAELLPSATFTDAPPPYAHNYGTKLRCLCVILPA